jgi:hypothetical protein
VWLHDITPVFDDGNLFRRYWFYFSGFIFLLSTGKKLPPEERMLCAYHSKIFTMSKAIGEFARERLVRRFNALDLSEIGGMLEKVGEMKAAKALAPK